MHRSPGRNARFIRRAGFIATNEYAEQGTELKKGFTLVETFENIPASLMIRGRDFAFLSSGNYCANVRA